MNPTNLYEDIAKILRDNDCGHLADQLMDTLSDNLELNLLSLTEDGRVYQVVLELCHDSQCEPYWRACSYQPDFEIRDEMPGNAVLRLVDKVTVHESQGEPDASEPPVVIGVRGGK